MTKKDIVKKISDDCYLTQLTVKEIVQRTLDEIIEALVVEGKIELRNFGVFKVTKRAARPARNPRTGDPVNVPAKCVVTFKPGKEMEARVRALDQVPSSSLVYESAAAPSNTHTPGDAVAGFDSGNSELSMDPFATE
jgi:integration host factor subunit beta|tara:strand:- start:822 stop:1232 length:411 start_codon:yes stop_codon:yes gene_type:complete